MRVPDSAVCFAAAVGVIVRRACARLFASSATLVAGAMILVSA